MKKRIMSVLAILFLGVQAFALPAFAADNPYPSSQTIKGVTTVPCTWYAWQETYDNTGVALPNWGNAGNWYQRADAAGYAVGTTAKANSIAVWSGDTYGHVSYVVSVNGSKMTVNEGGAYNSKGGAYNGNGIYKGNIVNSVVGEQKGNGSTKILVGFIYPNEKAKKLTIRYNSNGGKTSSDTYGLTSSGLIKTSSDGNTNIQIENYGVYEKWGLYDYDTFGIYKDGYTFGGWTLEGGTKVYDMSTPWYPEEIYPDLKNGSATITAYAVWNPNKLTIKYNANGGTVSSDTYGINGDGNITKLSNSSVLTQTESYGVYEKDGFYNNTTFGLYKQGYTFGGWTIDNGTKVYDMSASWCPEEVYPNLKSGSATITARAVWNPNELTIKYNANGGSISSDKSSTYYLASDGLVKEVSDDDAYTQSRKYGVFSENGFVDDTTLGLVRNGYTFEGWSFAKSGSKVYSDTESWNPENLKPELKDSSLTVVAYAIWKANGHSYGAWKTVKAATCTSAGSQQRVCSECSAVETKSIAAKGHTYSNNFTVDKAATCTSAGSKSRHCINCSAKTDVTTVSALSHSFGEWQIVKEATKSSAGQAVRKCTRSGCTESESKTIAKLSEDGHQHKYGQWQTVKEATCTQDGVSERKCSICSASETAVISHTGHDFGQWQTVKEATETAEGEEQRKCLGCGQTESQKTQKLPQSIGTGETSSVTESEQENQQQEKEDEQLEISSQIGEGNSSQNAKINWLAVAVAALALMLAGAVAAIVILAVKKRG